MHEHYTYKSTPEDSNLLGYSSISTQLLAFRMVWWCVHRKAQAVDTAWRPRRRIITNTSMKTPNLANILFVPVLYCHWLGYGMNYLRIGVPFPLRANILLFFAMSRPGGSLNCYPICVWVFSPGAWSWPLPFSAEIIKCLELFFDIPLGFHGATLNEAQRYVFCSLVGLLLFAEVTTNWGVEVELVYMSTKPKFTNFPWTVVLNPTNIISFLVYNST
jgi:hypothetical protein